MHKAPSVLALIAATCLYGVPAGAETRSSLTLTGVESRVREGNGEVRAALARAKAARSTAAASLAWPSPGLGVTYDGFPRPGLDLRDSDRKSLDLYLSVPFPGKTFLAWRTASAEADQAGSEARSVVAEKVFMARQAYWDLVVAARSARVLERAGDALAKLADLSAKRNRFGQVGRTEQLMDPMARMERAALKSRVLALAQERREAVAALNELMGLPAEAEIGEPEEPDPSVDAELENPGWLVKSLDDSPAVAVALRDLKRVQARRDQALGGWLPDFMLQYSAAEMRDGTRAGMAMARVDIPLMWFWRPLNENKAAAAEAGASGESLAQARLEVQSMAGVEIDRFRTARERLAIFRVEVLPDAEKALDLAVSGYQSGSIGPADVLTAVRSYIDMNIEGLMLSAKAGRSAAVLARLRGR